MPNSRGGRVEYDTVTQPMNTISNPGIKANRLISHQEQQLNHAYSVKLSEPESLSNQNLVHKQGTNCDDAAE